jgi:hypothetical protein
MRTILKNEGSSASTLPAKTPSRKIRLVVRLAPPFDAADAARFGVSRHSTALFCEFMEMSRKEHGIFAK